MTKLETEIHELLHVLWTKAVDTERYDKSQWMKLEKLIRDLIDIAGENYRGTKR